MFARSIIRSVFSASRMTFAMLLAVLMVFPDGVAWAGDTRCPATAGWNTSGVPLTNPIETFGAAVASTNVGDVMYVIGGYNNTTTGTQLGFQNQILHKRVSGVASGTPGTWYHSSLWKDPLSTTEVVGLSRDLCGVTSNGYLYTVGGVYFDSKTDPTYGNTTNMVWFTPISAADGSLGPSWTKTTSLPVSPGLQLHGTVVLNGYIYVIGGSTDPIGDNYVWRKQYVQQHVYFAKLDASNGTVGGWTQTTDITTTGTGLYKTCPVAYNGSIYVSGGESAEGALSQVVYATPNSDGSISAWNPANGLTISGTSTTDSAQAVVYKSGITLIAGDQTGHGNDWPCVFQGGVVNGGNITWNIGAIPQLPINVSRNAGATSGSYIFSLGGSHGGTDVPTVYYRTVP